MHAPGADSVVATERPSVNPHDLQPLQILVGGSGPYRISEHLKGLSLQLKQKDLADFGRDEAGGKTMEISAVIAPRTEMQLAEILKRYSVAGRPVTIASANTGLSRGAVPSRPGEEVLSMRWFTQLPEASALDVRYQIGKDNTGNSFARVAAGIPLAELQEFVESQGLYYPPDPTERTSLIGGNMATNASGPRTFKYGPTRDWVRALRVVLANGEVLNLRRGKFLADDKGQFKIRMQDGSTRTLQIPDYAMPKVKNAAGYYAAPRMDLMDMFIGSEGTLGVITQVEVGLIPKPAHRYSANVYFPSEQKALGFVKSLRVECQFSPSLLEYFDAASVAIMREKDASIHKDARAAIYFEQEISALEAASALDDPVVEAWRQALLKYDAMDIQEAVTEEARIRLRDQRHHVPEEVNRQVAEINRKYPKAGITKVASDIAVPVARFDEMMKFYRAILDGTGIPHAIWGHIGNAHVHVNMIPQNPGQFEKAKTILLEFARKAKELGGTITAEHGTGKIKVPQLEILYGPKAMAQMAAVKRILDPAGILCPGNIIGIPGHMT